MTADTAVYDSEVTPRSLPLPSDDPDLDCREALPEGVEMTVFHIVKTANRSSTAFVDSFRSRAELRRPPRTGTPEETHPALHDGISCWESSEVAIANELHLRKRDRGIGDYVAAIRLDQVAGATYYVWGPPGHLTVWADAVKLADATVDILPVVLARVVHAIHDPRQSG